MDIFVKDLNDRTLTVTVKLAMFFIIVLKLRFRYNQTILSGNSKRKSVNATEFRSNNNVSCGQANNSKMRKQSKTTDSQMVILCF